MDVTGVITMACVIYTACKMSGRDKAEMVKRAHYVKKVLTEAGLIPISPVIEEHVKEETGKLINSDKNRLKNFWKRDKEIIRQAHVVLLDHAEMKSFGMEREYGFNRYCLWRPTVIVVEPGTVTSVAEWEDDAIFTSLHEAAQYISKNWGTWPKRVLWRLSMLNKHLLRFVWDQLMGWR